VVAARRNVLTLALCALAGCRQILGIDDGVVAGGNVDSAIDEYSGPTSPYRKQINIESPVDATLEGFVVPIMRRSDPDLAAHASAEGLDLFFTQDGELLPFELVRFDKLTGALEAWVRLPVLENENRILLEYGGAPLVPAPSRAWAPDVAGAWHLSSPIFAQTVRDSSPHAHVMTVVTPTAPSSVMGIAGAALSFAPDQRLDGGDPPDGTLDFAGGFSVSLWVRVTVSSGTYDKPLYKGGSSSMEAGYTIELGAGNWNMLVSDGMKAETASMGSDLELLGRWVQLAGTVDRNAQLLSVYADGVLRGTQGLGSIGSISNSRPFTFGHPTYGFSGLLDEVRMYSTVKPAGWFAAEHAFLTNGEELVLFSPEEN
jgi:hypothetical protein